MEASPIRRGRDCGTSVSSVAGQRSRIAKYGRAPDAAFQQWPSGPGDWADGPAEDCFGSGDRDQRHRIRGARRPLAVVRTRGDSRGIKEEPPEYEFGCEDTG